MALLKPIPRNRAPSCTVGHCCPECRANRGDQWWQIIADIEDELREGFELNKDGFKVRAGACSVPTGNHFAAYGGAILPSKWDISTSNAVHAAFWSTSPPGPSHKFFEVVKHALHSGTMEVHWHRNSKKTYGTFGMQCRRCGMTLVVEWPHALNDEDSEIARQLLACFVHPQPYLAAIMDKQPEEKKWCTLMEDDESSVDSNAWEEERKVLSN